MNSITLCEVDTLWYAIYTKYKCEKQVVRDLSAKGVHSYIPLIERVRRYTRKIKRYQVPLLNCYVFVKINKSDHIRVLETENVIKFIKPGKELVHIPEEEINILKRLAGDAEVEISINPISYVVGEMVQITKGNLIGMKGLLVKRENKNMVVIDLSTIGYQLNITVDVDAISKL
jgi:transcription antitermination factor NusG